MKLSSSLSILAFFHDLVDDKVERDGSNIGDVVAPSHPLSWECAMADAPGQLSEVAESLWTHTPLDPRMCPRVRREATTKAAEPAATCASTLGAP